MRERKTYILSQLDLLAYRNELKMRQGKNGTEVFDPVRKKYVAWQPEELVRQLWICFLTGEAGIPRSRIAVERNIRIGKLNRRFDLLLFDTNGNAWMIIECKKAGVLLDQLVADQAGRYNSVIQAPFLLISNGQTHLAFELDFASHRFFPLSVFPPMEG